MKHTWMLLLLGCLATSHAWGAVANRLDQHQLQLNLQSFGGVPLSSVQDHASGSNGKAPTIASQQALNLTEGVPTSQQFQGFSPVSGGMIHTQTLPGLTLRRSTVGRTFFINPYEFRFGDVIPPPNEDESGNPLSKHPTEYWFSQPDGQDVTVDPLKGFYYSTYSKSVYAVAPGTVTVTWIKRSDPNTKYPKTYFVSPVPSKAPRKMYYNADTFINRAPVITIPDAVEINPIFTAQFPETLPQQKQKTSS